MASSSRLSKVTSFLISSFPLLQDLIKFLLHFVLKTGHFIHQIGPEGSADPSNPPLDPLLIVFKDLYSAPQQPWANRGAFGSISSKKKRQVLRSDKDVERLDDRREARAEGGRRFQREGAITAKDLDMAMVVLARGTKSSRLMKGGRGSSSQDLSFTADNTERKSDSRTGRKLAKVDVVVENCGGGASIVVARRRPVLEVSMSRKSEAVKDGVSRGREGLPSTPEMEDNRGFGFLEFLATRSSQYAASLRWYSRWRERRSAIHERRSS